MNILSDLYYKAKYNLFYNYKNDEEYLTLESQGFEDYIRGLETENKDLKLEVERYKQGYLNTENELLKEKVGELENLLSESMQENFYLSDRVEELEREAEHYEELSYDFYNTYDKDNNSFSDVLNKVSDERNTYKEVINVMCDKFNIEHDEVFNIIDDIQNSKDNQLEKEFI